MSQQRDVKPNIAEHEEEGDTIRLHLQASGTNNSEPVTVRAKPSTLISKIINAYAKTQGVNPGSIRLTSPEGVRMNSASKLSDYNIEDNDQLDVFIEQTGGWQ